jgi:hypothetical protein
MLDALLDIMPPGSRVCDEQLEHVNLGLFRRSANLPVQIGPRPDGTAGTH